MAVTAQASPNMTVNIASGWAAVVATTANLGVYSFYNDATVIQTISASDITSPRIDLIVATVNDAQYSGSLNSVVFAVVTGTPGAGQPATPSNSIVLAQIAVAANATTITNSNITDRRVYTSTSLLNPITAGTTSAAPMKLTAGTNLSTAVGGSVEYDGAAFYATPNSAATNTTNGGRGLITTPHHYLATANYSIASPTTALQPVYAASGSSLSLAATNYLVEGMLWVQIGAGSTSTIPSLQFTFTGTTTSSLIQVLETWNLTGFTGVSSTVATYLDSANTVNSTFAITVTNGSATSVLNQVAYCRIRFSGIVRVATAGSFTPQISLSSNTGITIFSQQNSWMRATPLGSATSVGAWS
jgi:hypothetical protein